MKTSKQEKEVTIQLKMIEILDIEMKHPEKQLPDQSIFNFNINLEHKINPDRKLVIVVSSIQIFLEDKQTKLALFKASCIFEVLNLDDFMNQETKQVEFPEDAIITFNSITISTVRGIMFSQFKGTFLHNAILPVIDLKSFKTNN